MDEIIKAFNKYSCEKVTSITKLFSNQNNVYCCNTNKGKYVIKQYSRDAIKNKKSLQIRNEQIRISKIWNEHGISCILPLSNIYLYHGYHYIVYPYIDGKIVKENDLSLEQIKKLAKLQARIHKLNIDSFLDCHLKEINIDDKKLEKIINKSNKYICKLNNNYIICHNDYKSLNIIWIKNKPVLIDFDAVLYNHPSVSLFESAYTFSYRNKKIDLKYYKEYINSYKKEYGKNIDNINEALYACWNGKLQWIKYLKETKNDNKDLKDLINQVIYYDKHVKQLQEIISR